MSSAFESGVCKRRGKSCSSEYPWCGDLAGDILLVLPSLQSLLPDSYPTNDQVQLSFLMSTTYYWAWVGAKWWCKRLLWHSFSSHPLMEVNLNFKKEYQQTKILLPGSRLFHKVPGSQNKRCILWKEHRYTVGWLQYHTHRVCRLSGEKGFNR